MKVAVDIAASVAEAEIGSLIDVWRLRFGTRWVGFPELMDDAFIRLSANRLMYEGHLEYHPDFSASCRLKERW